ncbi:MAG: hypothetical protein LBL47_03990, partial [Lactobacillus sp.]|nr:hypothetical protein [Lactobacillus sp.]
IMSSIILILLGFLFLGWIIVEALDGGINGIIAAVSSIGEWFKYEPETRTACNWGFVIAIVAAIILWSLGTFFMIWIGSFFIGRIWCVCKERYW